MPRIAPGSRAFLFAEGIKAFDPDSPDFLLDPTTLPVYFAFTAIDAEPEPGDWHAGQWVNPTKARILVGPPDGVLLPGPNYDIHINVVGAVESPAWKIGQLSVTTQ